MDSAIERFFSNILKILKFKRQEKAFPPVKVDMVSVAAC